MNKLYIVVLLFAAFSFAYGCSAEAVIETAKCDGEANGVGCGPIPPAIECTEKGVFPTPDNCIFYQVCTEPGTTAFVKSCEPGNYFSAVDTPCIPIPEPFACTESGTFRDPISCQKHYVCDGTNIVATQYCAFGWIYSTEVNECIADDGSCTDLTYCAFY